MIILFISIILDGLLSNISIKILPLFTLCSLILNKDNFKSKENYIILAVIMGMLYDILYTDLFYLTALEFSICALFIISINKRLVNNIINTSIMILSTIILYRFSSYVIYAILNKTYFSYTILLKSIYFSLAINMLYAIFIYLAQQKLKRYKKH